MTPEELAKVKVDLWINIENLEREIRDVRTRFRAIITGDGAAMSTALAESESIANSKAVGQPALTPVTPKPAPAAAKPPKGAKTAAPPPPPPPPPSTTTAPPPVTTTQDDGLGALDEGPAITMDDLIKASVAAVKVKGRGAWREELDKYTKGKIQELPQEHWRAFHSFLTS